MPGRGTSRRTIRVEDDLWLASLAKAEARDEVLAEEIRKFLRHYVKRKDKPRSKRR